MPNPIKPPHTPGRKEIRPQLWDTTTPARRVKARSHHTPGGTNPPTAAPEKTERSPRPPARGGPPPQTTTGKLNPPAPSRHDKGGGTLGNPTPKKRPSHPPPSLTNNPSKPAGATAQPAEPEPGPTKRADSLCMYISQKAHRAGPRPAATRNTNSKPVNRTAHRPVHAPAQGGQREEQANLPPKKNDREGGKPQPRTNRKRPSGTPNPTNGGNREGQSHSRKATHPHHRGGQPPPARRHRGRRPQDPSMGHRKTIPPSLTTPSQTKRPTTTTQPARGKDDVDKPAHTPAGEEAGQRPLGCRHSRYKKLSVRKGRRVGNKGTTAGTGDTDHQ